jgi:hypothetical protein
MASSRVREVWGFKREARGVTAATERWRDAFTTVMSRSEVAEPLKEAALAQRLREWTTLLTSVVVDSCRAVGWMAAAKGFALEFLPQSGQEYLGLDVMAIQGTAATTPAADRAEVSQSWRFPVAVFELENSRSDARVAYSLWKTLCVRASLRVVFAYRADWESGVRLVQHLGGEVVGAMPIDERTAMSGDTLIVLGSRGEGQTFPHGYFKTWRLNTNTGWFDKL